MRAGHGGGGYHGEKTVPTVISTTFDLWHGGAQQNPCKRRARVGRLLAATMEVKKCP